MKKAVKEARSRTKPQLASKSQKPPAKRVPTDNAKTDFIGRLNGVFRIVGDIESPVEPPEAWECCREDDLEKINQAAERLNTEADDVIECQSAGLKPRGKNVQK